MVRVRAGIKDIYQQVSDTEYNRINPYAEMKKSIINEYPDAKLLSAKTTFEVFGSLSVPMLVIRYETD